MGGPRVLPYLHRNPEPTQVEQFFSKLAKDYSDKADKEKVTNLIGQYQKNNKDIGAFENLQLDLEKSDIGPSKRIETQNRLNEMQKIVIQKDKAIMGEAKRLSDVAAKTKVEEKKAAEETAKKNAAELKRSNERKEVGDILRLGGETDEEVISSKSDYMSPAGARFEATKNLTKKKPKTKLGGNVAQKEIQTKIITPIQEAGKKAKELLMNATDYRNAIEELKGGSSYYKHVLNSAGGKNLLENTYNAAEQTVNSLTKKSILQSGELKGLRITDEKLRYIQGALPGPLKSYEANIAAYDIWRKTQEVLAKKSDVLNEFLTELEEAGEEDYPSDFDAQLDERYNAAGLNQDINDIANEAKKVPENPNAPKNKFDDKPDPAKHKGQTIKDDKTGKKFISNGKEWVTK